MTIATISTDTITLDADLQPRAQIHEDVLTEYGHRMAEGVAFPPVVVFFDGVRHWLADGYHRWHAHRALGLADIDADVRQGSKRDAMLHSLAANAEHGRQRGGADLRKAYDIAVRYDLVKPVDAAGVAALLACSERWARELTREAREAAQQERDAAILEARAEGASLRDAGARVGVDHKTALLVEKRKASETPQGGPQAIPFASAVPVGWAQVLTALAVVGALPPLDELFEPVHPEAAQQAARHVDHAVAWFGGLARRLASA